MLIQCSRDPMAEDGWQPGWSGRHACRTTSEGQYHPQGYLDRRVGPVYVTSTQEASEDVGQVPKVDFVSRIEDRSSAPCRSEATEYVICLRNQPVTCQRGASRSKNVTFVTFILLPCCPLTSTSILKSDNSVHSHRAQR
jgi:hypothetical protein